MIFDYTWIMSGITIFTMWFAGDRKKLAWQLGLVNQVLWAVFIVQKQAWGLVPMCIALCFTYARNLIKWSK